MKSGGFGKYLLNTVITLVAGRTLSVVREEFDAAKKEVQEKARGIGAGIVVLLIAITVGLVAVSILLVAGVLGLATIWPTWLAALVVGGGTLVIALILAGIGSSLISRNKNLKPERAITNLRRYFHA